VPETLHILHYEYVSDMAERRAPHREAHLKLIGDFHAADRIVIAGAVGDPPHGGLIAFRSAADAEEFRAADPYGEAGLVVKSSVEPWTVVAG
jgi:uncharacterized protein YciI